MAGLRTSGERRAASLQASCALSSERFAITARNTPFWCQAGPRIGFAAYIQSRQHPGFLLVHGREQLLWSMQALVLSRLLGMLRPLARCLCSLCLQRIGHIVQA